ncbi:MAG: ATP-dependent helicase [Velocimicrobium sp.]
MKYNNSQLMAIEHNLGPALVLAGPGSGKTAVITQRTKCLIEKGINPRKILVVTFTKAAAIEMKERFQILMQDSKISYAYRTVQFGTFHAIFFSILKHAYHYNVTSIIREEEKTSFFRDMIKSYSFEIEDEGEFISELESEISLVKGEMMDISHYYSKSCSEEIFREIYAKYQDMLRSKRKIDFDDMLVYCYELLSQRSDILAMWQEQFQYIMIDEFQDINKIQYAIIKLLALPENNLFIVGDDDQSIYRFRGAKPEIMLNFGKDYKDAKQVLLDINYRCNASITEGAARVIKHNQKRFIKDIKSNKKKGKPIIIKEFPTCKEENRRVAWEIINNQEKGIELQEMAVLFRTNTQPRMLIETLMQYNIPFCMKDAIPNIYEHFIGRDMICYIRTALGNRERKLFMQIANRPKRYISREAFINPDVNFEQLRIFYEDKNWMLDRIDQWESDLKWLKKITPYAAITYIRKGIGYNDFLEEYADYRRIKVDDLYEILDEIAEAAKPFESYDEWFEHIEAYGITLKEQARKNKENKEGIVLSTMHSAKGLEYQTVFLIDANETVIPHHKASITADLEEERRMFYVAMTRAKENLHIYYTKERFNKEMEVSRFVKELMEEESK